MEWKDLEELIKEQIDSSNTDWKQTRRRIKDKVRTLSPERQEYYTKVL